MITLSKGVFFCSILALCAFTSCQNETKTSRDFYELSKYAFDSLSQSEAMDAYLSKAYLPALKRQGIGSVGVFKNRRSETDSAFVTYVLVPYAGIDRIQTTIDQLNKDDTYTKVSSDVKTETPLYIRRNSVIMRAFSDRPLMKLPDLNGPRKDRIYELRSYESPTDSKYWNKVDMFNAGDEVGLFDKLDFNSVFYGEVISGPSMPNLMYMTSFDNQESRDDHWKAFVDSDEWSALKTDPNYQKNVSKADIYFLYPTAYSDY